MLEYGRNWRRANPEKVALSKRSSARKADSGWTPEAFQAAWTAQAGGCAICGVEMSPTGLTRTSAAADHCHLTGKRRAILCRLCNSALGHFRDDPKLLRTAADYLERFAHVLGD